MPADRRLRESKLLWCTIWPHIFIGEKACGDRSPCGGLLRLDLLARRPLRKR